MNRETAVQELSQRKTPAALDYLSLRGEEVLCNANPGAGASPGVRAVVKLAEL